MQQICLSCYCACHDLFSAAQPVRKFYCTHAVILACRNLSKGQALKEKLEDWARQSGQEKPKLEVAFHQGRKFQAKFADMPINLQKRLA